MVALGFTDEIVYKNTYSVYVFIGLLTSSEISEDRVRLSLDRLIVGCDNLECAVPPS